MSERDQAVAGQLSTPDPRTEGLLSDAERDAIRRSYDWHRPRNEKLMTTVDYILDTALAAEQLKIHDKEIRLKEVNSLISKCTRKNVNDVNAITDVVGARIICMFRSDMERVEKLIYSNFDVKSVDNKLMADNSPLGYISVHYICQIPARYAGPHYDGLRDASFEIQVRTLCMHCWAIVSHHLDYKGDWDVPAELKRALSALSGLFYVADREFEQFYAARQTSLENAQEIARRSRDIEVNLDTLTAYLATKFPGRRASPIEEISELVHQIKQAGYEFISAVDDDITRAEPAFSEFEEKEPRLISGEDSSDRRFMTVGAARICLSLANKKFDSIRTEGGVRDALDHYRSQMTAVDGSAGLRTDR